MRESYYEETSTLVDEKKVNKKYNVCKTLSYIGIGIVFVWFLIFILLCNFNNFGNTPVFIILNILLWILPFIVGFLMFFIFKKIAYKSCSEYDYSFLSGSVRIAIVPKNGTRRGVMKFDTSSIERIGKVDSQTYKNYFSMPNVKKIKLTSNSVAGDGKELYYMFIRHEGARKLLVFDCTKLFISNVAVCCNRNVLDRT